MTFNRHKLHGDILAKLAKVNKSQDYLAKKLNMGRSTIARLAYDKDIKLDNYVKLLNWLDKPFENYITK